MESVDVSWTILSNAEVHDAMNWVISSGSDPRFANIGALMRGEDIWKYWTRRDMPEVYEGKLPWKSLEQGVPSWKVVYLWFRLACSVYQRNILAEYQSTSEAERGAFPPGTILRLKRLNVIEMTVPGTRLVIGETRELSFKSQFQRILSDFGMVRPGDKEPSMYYTFIYMNTDDIITILRSMYPNFTLLIIERYAQHIALLLLRFDDIVNGKVVNWNTLNFSNETTGKIPRLYEATKIIVAAPICASCGAQSPTKKCSCPCATPYCGKECQKEHHSLV